MVTEFHLDGLGTRGQAQQLVAQADTEHRDLGLQKFLNGGNGIITRSRITRTIGEEDTVRVHGQYLGCRGLGRNHGQAATAIGQHAQNVALGTKVIGHHMVRVLGRTGVSLA